MQAVLKREKSALHGEGVVFGWAKHRAFIQETLIHVVCETNVCNLMYISNVVLTYFKQFMHDLF